MVGFQTISSHNKKCSQMTADALLNALVHVSWYARERRIPRRHHHHRHAHRRCILFRSSVHAESNYKSQSEEYRVNYRCAGHCKMDINPSEMKVPVAIEEDRQHVSHSFKPATLTLLLLLRLCC